MARVLAPECPSHQRPTASAFLPSAPHLSDRLNALSLRTSGRNVRHEIANAPLSLMVFLVYPEAVPLAAEEREYRVRQVATMSRAFFGVARDWDAKAWGGINPLLRESAMRICEAAEVSGEMTHSELEILMEVLNGLSAFKGELFFYESPQPAPAAPSTVAVTPLGIRRE